MAVDRRLYSEGRAHLRRTPGPSASATSAPPRAHPRSGFAASQRGASSPALRPTLSRQGLSLSALSVAQRSQCRPLRCQGPTPHRPPDAGGSDSAPSPNRGHASVAAIGRYGLVSGSQLIPPCRGDGGGSRPPPQEARDLRSQLPKEFRALMSAPKGKSTPPERLEMESLTNHVRSVLAPQNRDRAEQVTLGIFATLKEAVSPGELEDVAGALPPELQRMLAA
ncbi:MAG: DUF2267 domain-containing protein, partial [Anaerolineae bacterium]|nr:DUF2267 domain-containing protein [Anaerolineae bacterium]